MGFIQKSIAVFFKVKYSTQLTGLNASDQKQNQFGSKYVM